MSFFSAIMAGRSFPQPKMNIFFLCSSTSMFPFMSLILTADPSLGRIDYSLLSDQALMEILFDGIRMYDGLSVRDENGNFKEITEWPRIRCIGDSVAKLRICGTQLSDKQFPFDFIPPRVTVFKGFSSNLHGTLDPSVLPHSLIFFDFSDNKLHGSVDLRSFPEKLQEIDIHVNSFSGSLDLTSLPASIMKLDAGENAFSGEVSLNHLPSRIEELYFNQNSLSGSISIEKLPETLAYLKLDENEFEGDFRLLDIPPNLKELPIFGNKWDRKGKLVLPRDAGQGNMHLKIYGHCIAVVDECGNTHPWEKEILEIQREREL